jgi:hypothetical protein
LSSVPTSFHPYSEPQIVPSLFPEQPAPSSAPSPRPETSNTQPDQPASPTANANGFDFAPNLLQLRLTRARDHQIVFHAAPESQSSSPTTQRSLIEPPIPTPPPDSSQLLVASTLPELVTPDCQEGQKPAKAQAYSQENEAAELPDQSRPQSVLDSQSVQDVSQPEPTLESAVPSSPLSSGKAGSQNHSSDVLQSAVGDSNVVKLVGASNDTEIHPMKAFYLNTGSAGTHAETQNGFGEQRSRSVHENGNRANGHAHSRRSSNRSVPSECWPLPHDHGESLEPTLLTHLTSLFATKEWADWSIEVSSPVTDRDHVGYLAHGMLIARSPTLRQEMRRHLLSHRMERVIIISPDRYIHPQAFEAVLRYLYTGHLLTKPEVEQTFTISGHENERLTREYRHDVVLSYWMAGLILGLRHVVHQAVKLVCEIMSWDILELTFYQAEKLGECTFKTTAELSNTHSGTPGGSTADSASAASPVEILRSPFSLSSDFIPTARSDATSSYRYPAINAMMSQKLKSIVYEFICQRVDVSRFETEEPSTTILESYLPETREYSNSSSYKSNPALAAIRFGSMPLAEEDITLAKDPSATLRNSGHATSAILLNLRYVDLYEFCLILKKMVRAQPAAGSLHEWIQQVIAERERRRRKVLTSKTVSNQERLSKEHTWNVVGWEEYIEATDDLIAGWELRRKWTGFTFPARQ